MSQYEHRGRTHTTGSSRDQDDDQSRPSIASKIGDMIGINSGRKSDDQDNTCTSASYPMSRRGNNDRQYDNDNDNDNDSGSSGIAGKIGSMLGMGSSSSDSQQQQQQQSHHAHHHKKDDDNSMLGTASSSSSSSMGSRCRDRDQGNANDYGTTSGEYSGASGQSGYGTSACSHQGSSLTQSGSGSSYSTSSGDYGRGLSGKAGEPDRQGLGYSTSGSRGRDPSCDDAFLGGSSTSSRYTGRSYQDGA